MAVNNNAPWHPGEMRVKQRVGVSDEQVKSGRRLIRTFMVDQHSTFFERRSMIVVAGVTHDGKLCASLLFGDPGFIRCRDATTLTIEANIDPGEPLAGALNVNDPVALLGIDFDTRRRNRVNGSVTKRTDSIIEIAVQQSFGNCPRYIQRRSGQANPAYGDFDTQETNLADNQMRSFISKADLLFIASKYINRKHSDYGGIDVSHRGGLPGFLELDDEDRLLMPDFAGNNFFNTLGNLQLDPEVGLLIPDYRSGHLLHLYGNAQILWREEHADLCGKHERVLRFEISQGLMVYNRMPFLWRNIDDQGTSE